MTSTPIVLAILGIPGLGTPELLIILAIILVLFGPKRLPQLGKSLGKTVKAIRDGADGKLEEGDAEGETPVKSDESKATAEKKSDSGDDA